MAQRLTIEVVNDLPISDCAVEIVERKGVGHPDYICDAVTDRISVALSREYIKRFGRVLHHNIDKGLLSAGSVKKGFGGGRVVRPMEFTIGDRAVFKAGRVKIPVEEIVNDAVGGWFKENLRHVDIDKSLRTRIALAPGSAELTAIFNRKGRLLGANDTSASVGYAPLTTTEKTVFETERFLNSPAFKLRFPESGEDVKVMGIRTGKGLDITVACPLYASLVRNEKEYFQRKAAVKSALAVFLNETPFKKVTVNFNALDKKGIGASGVYLTLTGTSAEDADSGEVGRGNRVNGVISLNRPMGTEAAAGKNPVSHVGKIYTVLSHRMAAELYERVDGIREVYVWLLSQIGSPIDRPKRIYVKIIQGRRFNKKTAGKAVALIIEEFMSGLGAFTGELSRGEHPVC
ncbi:MAG: methionine adenosyltransferase [Deltaproteobacteria bacterium]|nr:methionine adenosyltransferase [Deltaproteobacteria bacterium]